MSAQSDPESQLEANTLPVFYYNDCLVSDVGVGIGLNLFEPRYKHMCHLMMDRDPRFLFVPNFVSYQCRVGDVAFVVRCVNINDNGRTFSIKGRAVERVIIDFMWVEHGTHGLHSAHYWNIPAHISGLTSPEHYVFCSQLISNGWKQTSMGTFENHTAGYSELIHNTNFENSIFLVLRTNNPEEATRLLQESWKLFIGDSNHNQSDFHRHVHVVHDFPESIPMHIAVDSMRACFDFHGLPYMTPSCFSQALADLQICRLTNNADISGFSFPCNLPTTKVELHQEGIKEGLFAHCLPFLEKNPQSRDLKTGVHIHNDTNVSFYAELADCYVTLESLTCAERAFRWRLNRPRLCVLLRAREKGMGPLATLQDDTAQLVCDFIAMKPLS